MKTSMLSAIFLFTSLLLTPLSAQDTNEEKLNCMEMYTLCGTICEDLDQGYEQCIDKCDTNFEKCSEQEDNEQESSK